MRAPLIFAVCARCPIARAVALTSLVQQNCSTTSTRTRTPELLSKDDDDLPEESIGDVGRPRERPRDRKTVLWLGSQPEGGRPDYHRRRAHVDLCGNQI